MMSTSGGISLYYMPSTFYSQKAAAALLEKEVPFENKFLNLQAAEHLEPYFIRMNKAGKVPLLKDGDKIIPESEDIIRYIDKYYNKGAPLMLTGNRDFDRIHQLLTENVPIEIITFGTLINRDLVKTTLHPSLPKTPEMTITFLKSLIETALKHSLEQEDLKEVYESKAEYIQKLLANASDRDKVYKYLEDLQLVFDEIDQQLTKTISDNPEAWLIHNDFTSVDIIMMVLMNSLTGLGQASRYYSNELRPNVQQYWNRIQQRKSFQDLMKILKKYECNA